MYSVLLQVADPTRSYAATPSEESALPSHEDVWMTLENSGDHSPSRIFAVPFYSQLIDITPPAWKKVACGIVSLAMIVDFYTDDAPSPDTLLHEGIKADAYLPSAGWTYAGLIRVAKKHGLSGQSFDFASSDMNTAFQKLETALEEGPIIVSVHYTFDPRNPIPHLVVARGIADGRLYYNDPADGKGSIPVAQFKSAWKKRYIEIRPVL